MGGLSLVIYNESTTMAAALVEMGTADDDYDEKKRSLRRDVPQWIFVDKMNKKTAWLRPAEISNLSLVTHHRFVLR